MIYSITATIGLLACLGCWSHAGIVSQPGADYDYVIVGGGSAGGVLANRLSADGENSVLLLDAGGIPWENASIPGLALSLQNTELDFAYRTVPQENACLGNIDRVSAWPRGKCLGGSSILNYMVYHRGAPADYDYWAKLLGKSKHEWGYEGLLPYFKRNEHSYMNLSASNDRVHGHNGPLGTSFGARTKYSQEYLKAAAAAGYLVEEDYNNRQGNDGFAFQQENVHDGIRQSTYEVYIKPALSRENLHVLTNVYVTKILFAGKTAAGVQYAVNGSQEVKTLKTNGKIILSAGAVGSPQILLNSGVGPKSELEKIKIPVKLDHPQVGKNLMDHIWSDFTFVYNESIGIDTITLSTTEGIQAAVNEYVTSKTGALANSIADVNSRFHSESVKDPGNRPAIQIIVLPASIFSSSSAPSLANMKADIAALAYDQANVFPASSMVVINVQPFSSGEITLKSNDAFATPLINPKYLSDPRDIKIFLDAYKVMINVAMQDNLKKYDFRLGEGAIPACIPNGVAKNLSLDDLTDDYLKCHVRHRTMTVYHPVGSCRMGDNRNSAVVDTKFRVHGLHRLFVADASVFPAIVSGNTNAATMMIGEKAADVIASQ